jgi:hypothetical protein
MTPLLSVESSYSQTFGFSHKASYDVTIGPVTHLCHEPRLALYHPPRDTLDRNSHTIMPTELKKRVDRAQRSDLTRARPAWNLLALEGAIDECEKADVPAQTDSQPILAAAPSHEVVDVDGTNAFVPARVKKKKKKSEYTLPILIFVLTVICVVKENGDTTTEGFLDMEDFDMFSDLEEMLQLDDEDWECIERPPKMVRFANVHLSYGATAKSGT